MKSLHFSYFNTVNVPLTFCKVYEAMGHSGRLLTLYKHRGNIPEDICLNKRIFNPGWLKQRRFKREKHAELSIADAAAHGEVWEFRPGGIFEEVFFRIRDQWRTIEFNRLAAKYGLYEFDIYHFHGGNDFFRDCRWVKKLAAMGKPILCHYHGPDIRSRGIIKEFDQASRLNVTSEFDLLALYPRLRYLPIPYDCSHLPEAASPGKRLRIIHTPSNPEAKGTHLIEPVLRQIARERDIEYLILTGVSHERVMEEKKHSHIAIEQIGNFGGTGYGVNSLETLAMNMPTLTEFTPGYARFLAQHPFIPVTKDTIRAALLRLIDDEEYRKRVGAQGRPWVAKNHSYKSVWQTMLGYMEETMPEVAFRLHDEKPRERPKDVPMG
jgi:glycosyltransferase involved in cell wall biosynthesis